MRSSLAALSCLLVLAGCSKPENLADETRPPLVRTHTLTEAGQSNLTLTGTVRARVESPVAFQVGGRIAQRYVDAGQTVTENQILFELDTRELNESVRGAKADLAAAEAAVRNADADLKRHQQLVTINAVSQQALDRAHLGKQEAIARRDSAQARLTQATIALEHAGLKAPAAGTLLDVTGEVGQVVAPGTPIGTLAHAGEREVEVYFPDDFTPPERGEVWVGDSTLPLTLREKAGAVDARSRTLRARYTLPLGAHDLLPGSVARTRFTDADSKPGLFAVPIAALNERGKGPVVWVIKDAKVLPVGVTVVRMETEQALIQTSLTAGERIVALGTHLLTEGQAVRESGQ